MACSASLLAAGEGQVNHRGDGMDALATRGWERGEARLWWVGKRRRRRSSRA